MMVITADIPVRNIVVNEPAAIAALEQFGIDYRCGGKHRAVAVLSDQIIS